MPGALAEAEVERIMNLADTDGSGFVEYSEWLVASISKSKMLTEDMFEKAFYLFDIDKTGWIWPNELEWFFGPGKVISEVVWKEII